MIVKIMRACMKLWMPVRLLLIVMELLLLISIGVGPILKDLINIWDMDTN